MSFLIGVISTFTFVWGMFIAIPTNKIDKRSPTVLADVLVVSANLLGGVILAGSSLMALAILSS
jgi:hypothetical protein